MLTVFDRISAEFSDEFQKDYEHFLTSENPLFQRICDTTGVLLIQDGDSNKLMGPWNSIKYAHDLLTGFLLFMRLKENVGDKKQNGDSGRNIQTSESVADHSAQVPMIDEMQDLSINSDAESVKTANSSTNLADLHPFQLCDGRYHCIECDYTGTSRLNLRAHINRMHHRLFRCQNCLRGFGLWKDLRRHHRNKTDCSKFHLDAVRGGHGRGKRHCRGGHRHRFCRNRRGKEDSVLDSDLHSDISGLNLGEEGKFHSDTRAQDHNYFQSDKSKQQSISKQSEEMTEDTRGRLMKLVGSQLGNVSELQVVIKKENPSDEDTGDSVRYMQIQPHPSTPNTTAMGDACEQNKVREQSAESTVTLEHSSQQSADLGEKEDLHYLKVTSTSGEENKFVCKHCSYTVDRKQLIEDHIKRIHIKQFRCDICDAMFGLLKDLNRHYRRTHKIMIETQRRGRRAQMGPPVYTEADPDYRP